MPAASATKEDEGTVREGDRRRNDGVQWTEAVMFVPYTPGGELCRRLQKADNILSKEMGTGRVSFLEDKGRTLASLLVD